MDQEIVVQPCTFIVLVVAMSPCLQPLGSRCKRFAFPCSHNLQCCQSQLFVLLFTLEACTECHAFRKCSQRQRRPWCCWKEGLGEVCQSSAGLQALHVDQNGCLLLCENDKPSKHFTVKKVRQELTSESSELANRPSMGINLAAATMEGGLDVLKLFPSAGAHRDEAKENYLATGLQKFKDLLSGDIGPNAQHLNVANGECTDLDAHKENVTAFLTHFGNKGDAEARMKSYAKVADLGLYLLILFSCSSLVSSGST